MQSTLFIIGQLRPAGGEERSLTLLCNELANRSLFDITIISLEGEYAEYPIDDRINVIYLDEYAKSRPVKFMHLMKMIRRSKYCLIIGYGIGARLASAIIGSVSDTPFIFCERMDPHYKDYPLYTRFKIKLGRILFRGKNGVFQSHKDMDYYVKLKKRTVIPNILDLSIMPDINRWESRDSKIINTSRYAATKNQAMLMRAFAAAHEKHPDYRLELYGHGVLEESLVELAKQCGAGDYISINPVSTNLFNHLNSAKIYVCSSNTEGYPNTLLEAMAMGMACISTRCSGGVEELIEDGINGLLVPINDAEAMERALVRLMEDDAFAQKLGKNAVKVRETNAKEKLAGKWIDFFNEVIDDSF